MKITKEELQQIIREELESVLDESAFGPKVGRKLSPDKYHYDKKKPRKHKKAQDLEYKPKEDEEEEDPDKYHNINKELEKKFGGKYKKLKEESEEE